MKQKQLITLTLSIVLFVLSNSSFAQLINERGNYGRYYISGNSLTSHYTMWTSGAHYNYGGTSIKFNIKHNIKAKDITVYKIKKKGAYLVENTRRINSFNKQGNLESNKYYKRGKEKTNVEYEYNSDGYFTYFKLLKKGEQVTKEDLKYNNYNDVLEYRRYNRKGIQSKWIAKYKDTLLVEQFSHRMSRKDTINIYKKWEYEYYPSNEKKETKYYKEGELKHTWSYTCDEEGKEIKAKGETKICEVKQFNNDGTYVIINRFTGKKGKITKTRLTYDVKDRLIMREDINAKNKIISKQSYKYNEQDKQTAWYYYGRGKKSDVIRWGREYVYNENSKISESIQIGKGGKAYSKYINTYNADNQKISNIYFDIKNNKQVYSYKYKYNESGLRVENLKYNKNNILIRKEIINYQYY